MIIKSYIQFLNESLHKYAFGCIMFEIPISNWNEITSIIKDEDVYKDQDGQTYGIQDNPHLTLLYPVTENCDFEKVVSVLESVVDKKIDIKIDKIDIFENQKFDVVKYNVENNEYLDNIHKKLKMFIPNDDRYDIYRPHITIAHVKSGTGRKYKKTFDQEEKESQSFSLNKITYVNSDGQKQYYEILI
jgi:2'-5' RNA ligase